MSVTEFSKNHGTTILGGGIASLALALVFTAHGAFSRIDDVKEIAQEMPQMVEDFDRVRIALRRDLADLKANVPDFGTKAGEGTANAVKRAEEILKDGNHGQEGVRGKALEMLNRFKPQEP